MATAYCQNDFYPRPPRGGRPPEIIREGQFAVISIHALREEGDTQGLHLRQGLILFLSTPSARRATVGLAVLGVSLLFLSTPSARRATQTGGTAGPPGQISIHALREEGDRVRKLRPSVFSYFYPRPPRGGRPYNAQNTPAARLFLSTPSARRATRWKIKYG